MDRGNFIQKNVTDKVIHKFIRVFNHINGLTITSYPYELDENLHLKLDNKVNINNEILNQVFDYVNHTK